MRALEERERGEKCMVIDMGAEGQWSWRHTVTQGNVGKSGDITERWQRRWSTEELMPAVVLEEDFLGSPWTVNLKRYQP